MNEKEQETFALLVNLEGEAEAKKKSNILLSLEKKELITCSLMRVGPLGIYTGMHIVKLTEKGKLLAIDQSVII